MLVEPRRSWNCDTVPTPPSSLTTTFKTERRGADVGGVEVEIGHSPFPWPTGMPALWRMGNTMQNFIWCPRSFSMSKSPPISANAMMFWKSVEGLFASGMISLGVVTEGIGEIEGDSEGMSGTMPIVLGGEGESAGVACGEGDGGGGGEGVGAGGAGATIAFISPRSPLSSTRSDVSEFAKEAVSQKNWRAKKSARNPISFGRSL